MATASEITATASGWLIRLEREATPELWEALQHWLESHPRHHAEFIRQRTAWNRCDKLKMLRPEDGTIDADLLAKIEFVDPEDEPDAEELTPAAGVSGRAVPARGTALARKDSSVTDGDGSGLADVLDLSRRGWLAAAGVACLAVLGTGYWVTQSGWETYRTEIGGRQQLALSDGSTVDLNTDSELRVRLTPSRRDLVLKRGEALFHVAHDKKRPFLVTAQNTVVRAVGTAFSVRIREDSRVEVMVTEGNVAVGTPESIGETTQSSSASSVSMGEDAAVTHGKLSARHVSPEEMARKLAWTTGHLAFEGETLDEAVGEFNRYNIRHLSIGDPAIVGMHFGGTFRINDAASFVAALEAKFHVRALPAPDGSGLRLIAAPEPAASGTLDPSEEPSTVLPDRDPQPTQDTLGR